jgi:metal-responsive CopG/Arc/MetJ family transcriptional regulator
MDKAQSKPVAISITLAPELVKMIDDYRFAERIPSRSAAIAHLVERGLEHHKSRNTKKK